MNITIIGTGYVGLVTGARAAVLPERLQFRGVRFRYANDDPWVPDGLSLVIANGSRVGFRRQQWQEHCA